MRFSAKRPARLRAVGALRRSLLLLAVLLLAPGCAASTTGSIRATEIGVAASSEDRPRASEAASVLSGVVLFLERGDLRLGTTVQYARVPTIRELHDLSAQPGLGRIVFTLDAWPDYEGLQPLAGAPDGVELVAVVAGYPPSRAAAEAWSLIRAPIRVVVVVGGPPPSFAQIDDLNVMRGLDRVIARMDAPSRDGFERLQRPLSFWKVVR